MKRLAYCFLLLLSCQSSNVLHAQKLLSGPWAGNIEQRTATIWLQVAPEVKKLEIRYTPKDKPEATTSRKYTGTLGQAFNPVKIDLTGLDMGTTYTYDIWLDGKKQSPGFETNFSTKELWQYRKPAPDFSFLAGSCAYFNEPAFDRPGKPYGQDSSIFITMAKTPAAFHIWLGDNWYTREADFSSPWGLEYRAAHDRATPVLQPFMASMPQYAIWDDHDYGPNDGNKSYIFKEQSRAIFSKYTLNPSYGENGKGIYTQFSYSDVDFFLMDDRYFRADDKLPDSIDGDWNKNKTFYGPEQFEWLTNALLKSRATFKIIVTGSQVLNPNNRFECLQHYPYEFNQLMRFISDQKIQGLLFLTGDRHHSEIIRFPRTGQYPLYDITASPYTSGIGKATGMEEKNPFRVDGTLVETQNFAKIAVTGNKNERQLRVTFINTNGTTVGLPDGWTIHENELKNK